MDDAGHLTIIELQALAILHGEELVEDMHVHAISLLQLCWQTGIGIALETVNVCKKMGHYLDGFFEELFEFVFGQLLLGWNESALHQIEVAWLIH